MNIYPFRTQENHEYWGGEWALVQGANNFRLGVVNHDEVDRNFTTWLKWGRLLASSDYTFVLSYEDLDPEDYFKLGWDYSRDFLNGLIINLGVNRHTGLEDAKGDWQYLIETQYIFKNNLSLLLGVQEQTETDHLLIVAMNNYYNIFADWQWEISTIIDSDTSGRINRLRVKYVKADFFTPELEIINCAGTDDSFIMKYPLDLILTLKMTCNLFAK